MTPVVVAGIWLALGVGISLLAGGGIGRAARRSGRCTDRPAAAPAPRSYVTLASVDWVRAADAVATEELLSLRPGAIRQVEAR